MKAFLKGLNASRPQKKDKKLSRKEALYNAHKLFKGREMTIDAFKNGFFPSLKRPPSFQEDEDKHQEFILKEERPKYTVDEFNKLIFEKEKKHRHGTT